MLLKFTGRKCWTEVSFERRIAATVSTLSSAQTSRTLPASQNANFTATELNVDKLENERGREGAKEAIAGSWRLVRPALNKKTRMEQRSKNLSPAKKTGKREKWEEQIFPRRLRYNNNNNSCHHVLLQARFQGGKENIIIRCLNNPPALE